MNGAEVTNIFAGEMHNLCSPGNFRETLTTAILRLVFTAGWSPTSLRRCHPLRWSSSSLSPTRSHSLQHQNHCFNLIAFHLQFGQHRCDVHLLKSLARWDIRS